MPPDPAIGLRPYFLVSGERFAARQTFEAIFDRPVHPLVGGGVQVGFRSGLYVDLALSRFEKSGERAFLFNDQAFKLGIPLTTTLTPVELTGGWRFRPRRRLVPYGGGGVGWYAYKEVSDFAAEGDNIDVRKTGLTALGGVELRAHRRIRVAVDAQYSHVPDILGVGGISAQAGEDDLGGVSARVRILVGR
jgi:hypothetical protein